MYVTRKWAAPICCALLAGAWAVSAPPITLYQGTCDASAAVALDANRFAVASDEDNLLRVYKRGTTAPLAEVRLDAFLGGPDEADLEGAAALGPRTYWIASHGRNRNGKARPARQRLFATEAGADGLPAPVGKPYTALLDDLRDAAALRNFDLADAMQKAPEASGGFNIEGLAAWGDAGLLIALRNPVPQGRALLLPLDNPAELLAGTARARFGAPIVLDLGGRGVRSIERVGEAYMIVAGPPGDDGSFAWYRWSGRAGDAPVLQETDFRDLRPEAVFAVPVSGDLQFLSDDGGLEADGVACKDRPAAQRAFRSITLPVPAR